VKKLPTILVILPGFLVESLLKVS